MNDRPLLTVIIASTRPVRVGDVFARWIVERARARDDFRVELVDLRDVNLPLLDEPEQAATRRYLHAHTIAWSKTIDEADAFIFVTPEYNHSFNAALKNALDFLYHEWRNKPVGLVAYGGVSSGVRSLQALKPVLLALGLRFAGEVPISTRLTPVVDGTITPSEANERAAQAMLQELATLDGLFRSLREAKN
ncbi:MAG: NAD(P)H-dependent oxidoreductase [Acidobacteriota bacterium]|nr:NAD(P)H-dependent oxidoreductase [Acidobacteriota bacterium]